jgi:hypothetical protein
MILLQDYLYTYNFLRGVTFEVLPLGTYALRPMILPLLETFSELLIWNTFQCRRHISFRCLQYPEIFVPIRQTFFLETAKSHMEPNQGNRVDVQFQ